ncbi:MAG TPA: alpha/beta hydrolase [Dehalococcoidia bacterium]|jgi:4,5:9,10-diseco-3-hydroxy-5,9,17-trioxoandrosta-1(10),2-diene-4-oate hydrolase|nr:alpha/beta hydrolase [Dehalococcoidia bacterium]
MTKRIRSQRIKVGELDIHYLTGGQGDPLIVIHGGSTGARAWVRNMEELSQRYTVYVPDLPGFGHSPPLDGDYYIPELVDFVDKFSHALGLKNFYLMGHSLGGGVALSYALRFPDKVTKLVLVSSLCLGREIALWVRFLSHCVPCRALGKAMMAVLKGVRWVAARLFATVELVIPLSKFSFSLGRKITTLSEQTTVLLSELSEIMVPTLVVWGAKDPILPVKQAYAAAQLIPNCQVKVFEDGGHSVYRDKVLEFSQTLTKFLG